jgi:aldose sugar dehydrogenase
MTRLPKCLLPRVTGLVVLVLLITTLGERLVAQPSVLDENLTVLPVVTGLSAPTALAFLGPDDFFVLEKSTGRVLRVTNGTGQDVVLDLAVNSASERGLLGIALHPEFPTNPGVYLFWTVSVTGVDSNVLSDVPLLGNRVDRFTWTGSTLAFDRNILLMRARQTDNLAVPGHPGTGNPAELGNHNGGVIRFGPDGMLYVFLGDVGRRGWFQNLPTGPFPSTPFVDDTFGGPAPGNAHLAGVVLRLNADGTTPTDNPFFSAGAAIGGEVGANVQRVFAYGHRNGFGMDFDPQSGDLWLAENGDDAFSELNRVIPGMNGGWVQIAGPVERIQQYKGIETTFGAQDLQQIRWPATNIPDTAADALARLYMLPGATYQDPAFSWKWEVAPGALGFLHGGGLGAAYNGDLFVGAGTSQLEGGYLFRFTLSLDRGAVSVSDPRLADHVADNLSKFDLTESESLLFGRDFGIVTHVGTSPNGKLVVVSHSHGAVYEVALSPPDDHNTQPVADAGPDQTVIAGTMVTLDGSGSSDADGDDLTFTWTLTGPGYFDEALAGVSPVFCAATAGTYTATLAVNDGIVDSDSDETTITVITPTAALSTLLAAVAALRADGALNAGQATALSVKLRQAQRLLAQGKMAQALNVLAGFREQVLGWSGGVLTEEQATALVESVDAILGAAGSPCSAEVEAPLTEAGVQSGAAQAFALAVPYPNPFRTVAILSFDVPETSDVRLLVYDVRGRQVAVLAEGLFEAARYQVVFDGSALPSGTYLVRMSTAGGFSQTERLTLLR